MSNIADSQEITIVNLQIQEIRVEYHTRKIHDSEPICNEECDLTCMASSVIRTALLTGIALGETGLKHRLNKAEQVQQQLNEKLDMLGKVT